MEEELVRIRFNKILQTRAYTVLVVGTEEKRFAIYMEPKVGKVLQLYLAGGNSDRPLTHDLLVGLFEAFGIRIKQVVLNDLQETVYFARLYLEQQLENIRHIVEIDARPSDCLTLALLHDIPVYCAKHILEEAVAVTD